MPAHGRTPLLLFIEDALAPSLDEFVAEERPLLGERHALRGIEPFSKPAPWWILELAFPRRFSLRNELERRVSHTAVRAVDLALGSIGSSVEIPFSQAQANERTVVSIALELESAPEGSVLVTSCFCCDADGLAALERLMASMAVSTKAIVAVVAATDASREAFSRWIRAHPEGRWRCCARSTLAATLVEMRGER